MSTQFTVAQTVQSMIDCNAPMVFYYTHSKPDLKRIVHPILIVNNHVVCVDSNTGLHKRFKLDGIQFPPENNFQITECEGCKYDCPGQRDHMGPGGCLSEDNILPSVEAPKNEEQKIISKTHFWDCGYRWNYDEDCCECGDRGWTRCLFSDGHQEVLNNM